jgi:hypothetical protein
MDYYGQFTSEQMAKGVTSYTDYLATAERTR